MRYWSNRSLEGHENGKCQFSPPLIRLQSMAPTLQTEDQVYITGSLPADSISRVTISRRSFAGVSILTLHSKLLSSSDHGHLGMALLFMLRALADWPQEILRTIASLNARTTEAECIVSKYERELSRTRQSLEKTRNDLEETVRVAEILYEVNRKLGTLTDYLLKEQGRLDDKDCNSFEAMFNILLKHAESSEDEPNEEGSNSDKQGRTRHRGGVIALD